MGTPDTHISALRAGRRGIGDQLAAKLERKCEKPSGWMDDSLTGMENSESRGRTPFAERMFQARMRLGQTQMQVCEELGIMHGTIFLLETTSSSSRRTVEFGRLYRCDPHWLATGEGSPGWDEQPDAVA